MSTARTPHARRHRPTVALAVVLTILAGVGAVSASGSATVPGRATAAGPVSRSDSTATAMAQAEIGAIDRLPIVVEDLPGASDRAVAAAWRRATVRNPEALTDMAQAAYASLVVDEIDRQAVDAMLGLVLDGDAGDSGTPDATVATGLAALGGDPANGDRLSNLLVAIWLDSVAREVDDYSESSWHLRRGIVGLLAAAGEAFPGRRAILLNRAFLETQTPGLPFAGESAADAALALDPGDVTARALLASIQSRRADAPDGSERAAATLAPLIADPTTAALGEALLGDAHLAVAAIRRLQAPAQSRQHAALALAAYDRALAGSVPALAPGLHAGRARALELLGDLAGAVAEQALAVDGRGALDWRIDLARLRHLSGDVDGLRASAQEAVAAIRGGWDPYVSGLRFVMASADGPILADRGFLGWSIGSDADHLSLSVRRPQGAGAPGVVIIDTVGLQTSGVDHDLVSIFGPRVAWRLALVGAVLDGEPATAAALIEEWEATVPWDAFWDRYELAARIAADGRAPFGASELEVEDAFEIVERSFERAGRASDAATLCDALRRSTCAGLNLLRAGDAAAAEVELRDAYELAAETPDGPSAELRMLVAAAAEEAGDLLTAERFLRETAGVDDGAGWRVRAAIRLGDLRLDSGDPAGAVAWYDLALASLDANGLATVDDYHDDAARGLEFEGLRQVARNNRGVAFLRTLQLDAESAPNCGPDPVRARCEEALADFEAAAGSDPANAVYRMNVGWASRLLGHGPKARAALETAVTLDPSLYPAFNDLGVLLAEAGDTPGARSAFEAAIAADPGYDLARWNLGVLEMRDVPGGIVVGQLRLAEAIRADRSLRTAPLDFRTDERTYRFGFEAALPEPSGAGIGRTFSVGAVVLAATTSVAALAQLQATIFGHGVQTAASSAQGWLTRQGRRTRWRARLRAIRGRLPRPARGILPWLAIGLVLTLITAWQAAQASPAAALAAIVMSLIATLVAVLAHGVGHVLVARHMGARLLPAAWVPGALVALAFLPLQAASGPFLGERLRLPAGGQAGAWRFHLAGPIANALVAAVAYAAFLAAPLPLFRLVAQVQLAAIAYTLLPVRPLDGWALQRDRPRLLIALGFAVVAAGAAFALELL